MTSNWFFRTVVTTSASVIPLYLNEDVLKAAGDRPSGQFYAHLYIGLYSEALGRKDLELKHIKEAASDRYASVGGYMHMVARVHARRS